MKSEESNNKPVVKENGEMLAEGVPNVSAGSLTEGVDTKDTTVNKKRGSFLKNIGSGMRTLRFGRRNSCDKKDSVLSSITIAVVGGEGEGGDIGSSSPQYLGPPQAPLPPLPSTEVALPMEISNLPQSPSLIKTLPKQKSKKSTDSSSSSPLKNNSSRLSLREHVSGKSKKGGSSGSGGIVNNGSTPRENSTVSKSGMIPSGNGESSDKADPARFIGEGLSFKGKLIGILEVTGPRGDRICQEALSELKMAVKAAGEHKQKVTIHVALDGLRIRDEKTGDCLYHHQVHKISFIAQDLTDTRAFGYIFGSPDTGHRFFGIKTEKAASQVVMSMRDLFQVVFDLKKKEIERAKQQLEMQQKFLATRAAETATRTSHKSGIAETYIDGACSLGGSPSPASAPAEADLLNLEVELTSLQEGLDNIHSTLIDTAHSHAPFNRGSTASISSDPMNPGGASFSKYNSTPNNNLPVQSQTGNTTATVPSIPSYTNTGNSNDPFGDSFDPFDSKVGATGAGPTVVSPSFPTDPFTNVDPFAGTKFSSGLEPTEFLTSDPFETPLTSSTFNFPEPGPRVINRQVSVTSCSSDKSSGKVSIGTDTNNTRPSASTLVQTSGSSPNFNKTEVSNSSFPGATNWTASFEENFGLSTNGNGTKDLFTDLDPLGTGRVKPFVDRKDFFQDLKNPPRRLLSEFSTTPPSGENYTGTVQSKETVLKRTVTVSESSPLLSNSFSTNFNPVHSTGSAAAELGVKVPPPTKGDIHLRTSSIRAPLSGDTPPSYSPPPPPSQQQAVTTTSPSVYFVNAPPKQQSTPPSVKKSPQLLRNMTIASATSVPHVIPVNGQSSSPKTLPRSSIRLGKQTTMDVFMGSDDIPNLTPPPRPPHTITSGSAPNRTAILPTALPRPHSGGEGKRQVIPTAQSTPIGILPPEPPPRPLVTSAEPFLSPPPLPPKKQTLGPILSNPSLTKFNYNTSTVSSIRSTGEWGSNDLPLPLPSRKGSQNYNSANTNQNQIRYAYPAENSASASPVLTPSLGRYSTLEETASPLSMSSSNLSQQQPTPPELTMEAALSQVASLSLVQLAGKLQIPVETLSSCTIQELAIKLTLMNLNQQTEPESPTTGNLKSMGLSFETNFVEDNHFSTISAPATVLSRDLPRPTHNMTTSSGGNIPRQSDFDKYAVFRELAESDAVSGFSLGDTLPPAEEEEDEQRSRTLTSRGSSSEKTLQADFDPNNGLSTMDDVTDVNFSEGEDEDEKSGLFDEVVELNLKAEWATFESNFDEQFIPLSSTFTTKSEGSPWDSDVDNNKSNFRPTEILTEQVQQTTQKIKSPKLDHHLDPSSQFDFQLFEKPLVSVEPVGLRRSSRGNDLRSHESLEPFQRQSSGSSRHSDRSIGNLPISSRNITTSEFSDSGKERERERSHRRGSDLNGGSRRRTDSHNSGTRRYSRDESNDEESNNKRRRGPSRRYHDDDDDETGSRSPVDRRRLPLRRRQDDDECYSNTSSRHCYSTNRTSRHAPSNKYHTQSLQRERERRYGQGTGRRPSENEKYSNHESDFDDSYEDERRRGRVGGSSSYSRSDRDQHREHRGGSRPTSSGGSVSGSVNKNRKQRYRDNSREYYYHHHRDHRHGRERTHGMVYHHSRNRTGDDDYDNDDGRELSDYSDGEESSKCRRRARRRQEKERERHSRPYYNPNSPSWESESPVSGPDVDLADDGEISRGSRIRRSDMDRPRERERDPRERERPSSSSYHGERIDSSNRRGSRYQSDVSLNTKQSNTKLSAIEFRYEVDSTSSHLQSHEHHRKFHQSQQHQQPFEPSRVPTPPKPPEIRSNNKNEQSNNGNSSSNKLTHDYQHHPPPESPFEDNFVTETNIFFPTDFSNKDVTNSNENEEVSNNSTTTMKLMNQKAPESVSTSGSLEKSDENEMDNSSPDVVREESSSVDELRPGQQKNDTQLIQIVRKPIISDTIHEVPDTEMKKSDSFNIFEREKDPFADDDFFT